MSARQRTTVKQGFLTHKETGWRWSHEWEVPHNFPDLVLWVYGRREKAENWKVLIVPCGIKWVGTWHEDVKLKATTKDFIICPENHPAMKRSVLAFCVCPLQPDIYEY